MAILQFFKNLFSSSSAIDADEGLEAAGKHWGERAREQVGLIKPNSWAECPIVNQEYICPLISGEAHVGWLEYVARKYYPNPVDLALSLGCGGGGLERHGLQLRIAERFDAFDVSAGALQIAEEEAQKSGQIDHISYAVANLNKLEFAEEVYDAVFASQSVHHIEALEHYMEQVRRCLKPGGYFIINEFVGPNQFQWTDVQLGHCQRLLEEIPEAFRQTIREPGIKNRVERPTVEFMNDFDPTEAIRSADIITELQKQFEIIERRDFGGTLLHLVLDNIAGNLSDSDEGKAILRHLFAEEQRLLASGEIDSDFTLLVARKN
jgi:ubiquinone/menaquinone biosynthesis C-methylase UbiE